MSALKRFTKKQISRYSYYVTLAVNHGVPYDDIISETKRFHGNEFTNAVIRTLS